MCLASVAALKVTEPPGGVNLLAFSSRTESRRWTERGSPRFIRMQMQLVQLSPQSIENMMSRPECLPLSLDNLLALIPMDWRKQSLELSAISA